MVANENPAFNNRIALAQRFAQKPQFFDFTKSSMSMTEISFQCLSIISIHSKNKPLAVKLKLHPPDPLHQNFCQFKPGVPPSYPDFILTTRNARRKRDKFLSILSFGKVVHCETNIGINVFGT